MNSDTKEKNGPQIFISYSSKDRKIVKKIHEILASKNNFRVWRDKSRIREDWSREIAFALAESDVLFLMWSKSAADSEWVEHEWLTARALEKRIVPFLFPDAPKLEEQLHNLQRVHLKESQPEAACQEVVNLLRESESFTKPYDYNVLPANSYIPFNPNPEFTGRHVDLLELYLKMIGNLNNIGINQVGTVGMAGVGKTQLAVEFAYRFSFAFDSVHWIQAADVHQWRSEFVELARDRLGLSISDPDKPQADKRYIFRLKKYCNYNQKTLIIMDNVIEPTLLNNDTHLYGLTPLTFGCNVLFTTRRHFRLTGVTSQAMDVLSPDSAYLLLTHNCKPSTSDEEDHARAICSAVGYLPLAIVLAKGYLNEYKDVSFSGYHAELSKNKLDVIDIGEISKEELATHHETAVGLALEQDWERITDENARLLFQLAGQVGEGEIIPKARLGLLSGIGSRKSKLHGPLDKAFNLLYKLSLAEKMGSNDRTLRLHPLVRNFAQKKVPDNKQESFRASAAENLRAALFDYPRLERELKACGVAEVIDDLQIAIDWWGKDPQKLQELQLLQSALRHSANQLTLDPQQLAPHLIGRLDYIKTANVEKLLSDAIESQKGPWLNPIRGSLTPPGGQLLRTFDGHRGHVSAVAFSPNGEAVVSVSSDSTLKLWDLSTGQALCTLEGQFFPVAVAICSDGKTAVSCSNTSNFKWWNLTTGKATHTLEHPTSRRWMVAIRKLLSLITGRALHVFKENIDIFSAKTISPDGKTAIFGLKDHSLLLLDLSSGKPLHTLKGHSEKVKALAISQDGKTAFSYSSDGTFRLWDLTSGKQIHSFEGRISDISGNAVAISSDGKTAISSSFTTITVWDLSSGKPLHTLEGHRGGVNALAISQDGKTLVSGSYDGTIKLWDLESGNTLNTLQGHSSEVTTVAISPNGKIVISGSSDKSLKLWEAEANADQILYTPEDHNDRVTAVAISPDGLTAASSSLDETLKVWNLSSGDLLHTLTGHSGPVNALAISPNGKDVFSGSYDNTMKMWLLGSGQALYTFKEHKGGIAELAISENGKNVVTRSYSNTLKVWDLDTRKALHTFEGNSTKVTSIAVSPDGMKAVSGSWDHTIKLWDLTTGKALHTFEGHTAPVSAVVISSNCNYVLSAGSWDKTIKLWNLTTYETLRTLKGHDKSVGTVALSPDCKSALSGSADKTLKLWDLTTGKALHTFRGHSAPVSAVAISLDGLTAVSSALDHTLKLWNLTTGKALASFAGDSEIRCLAISPNGRIVVAGEQYGNIHILRLEGVE